MRNFLIKLTLFGCLLGLTNQVSAQVTIGSSDAPASGALLDLKEETAEGANSRKGLGLPRVALELEDALYPMFNSNKTFYEANKSALDLDHIGLVVYNLSDLTSQIEIPASECEPMQIITTGELVPGIVVWDGEKWRNLIKPETKPKGDEQEIAPGVYVIKDIEGNSYTAADFGPAGTWMTQNMRSRTFDTESEGYANGLTFGSAPTWGTRNTPEWVYPGAVGGDGKDPQYFNANEEMGLLYNWAGAFGGVQTAPVNSTNWQGICPNGWRIPTYQEATALEQEIDSNPTLYTVSGTNRGNYNFFSNCGLSGVGASPQANSASKYNRGFALFYLSWIHMGALYDMGTNGAIFWLANSNGSKQAIPNIVPTASSITLSMWSDNSERSQTIVRCKKK